MWNYDIEVETCHDCPFIRYNFRTSDYTCDNTCSTIVWGQRIPRDCPLLDGSITIGLSYNAEVEK